MTSPTDHTTSTEGEKPPISDQEKACVVSASAPDLARVFVRLSNGSKIVVPISQDSTVDNLHVRTLERAQKLGLPVDFSNTILGTTGNDGITLSGEDQVADILDLTEANTFRLETRGHGTITDHVFLEDADAITPVPCSPLPGRNEKKIYIRWITIDMAVNSWSYSRLRKIPTDRSSVPSDTTLHDLRQLALKRLRGAPPDFSCTNPTNVNLFLPECRLHTDQNFATLNDLGLRGSKYEPLDIFVEYIGPDARVSLNQLSPLFSPRTVWNFNSTSRGFSTFVSSLQILCKEIERGRASLDGVLEVLLELTHFPPLLLAFKAVYDSGIDGNTPAGPLLLVATAIQALCRRMISSKLCPTKDSTLEASRQVICWIYSSRSEASLNQSRRAPLLHRVQVIRKPEKPQASTFLPFYEVNQHQHKNQSTSYLVSIEQDDPFLCRRLGLALRESSAQPWDYYFQPATSWTSLVNESLMSLLSPNEFESLIEVTNSIDAFKIVGPMQIGACLAAELPVLTLSATGYVSRYDHEDLECSERSFITWNAIEGRTVLPDNGGQFLSSKLEPLLAARKLEKNWELDAWAEWTKTADFGPPDEAIVICVDTSASMGSSMKEGWLPSNNCGPKPSRLTEVVEFFKNLALRISALNLSTHLGLVTFSSRALINVKQPLTPLCLNFNQKLDDVKTGKGTAIYSALGKAAVMLSGIKTKYPKTKCRIIVLTDGEDNNSDWTPQAVAQFLTTNSILLDAVVLGSKKEDQPNCPKTKELFKIARNTGGYAFAPQTQQALFQIFLLETVVDIRTRPYVAGEEFSAWADFAPKRADMANPFDFPPCRPHANLDDHFIALADAERFMTRLAQSSQRSVSARSVATRFSRATTAASAGGISRILLSEVKAMIENPHEYMDTYVSQSNMGFWKVAMQGPPDSAYSEGTFLIYIEIGSEFPRKPPSARFITPMLHPNITKHGRICHPIFSREWSPVTRVYQVLQQVYGILMAQEARDAIDPLSSLRFWSDPDQGRKDVREYVTKFGCRTRAQHRSDIVGDDVSSIDTNSTPGTSSYAGSLNSQATATSSTAPILPSAASNPFTTRPPSYRTTPSISGRTVSSVSTLLNHLNFQRGRHITSPPLLDLQAGNPSGAQTSVNSQSTSVTPVLTPSTGTPSGSVDGANNGRVVGRRASFFGLLRNVSS
ncbi:UBC-like protein [Glarea lozoyensis ATCC 20868]|uniref:UBC-like protein n=1 Tax=Glarea lozoyensis (strain ATCC 20868 / MF5171) TaxID=1116229 RepID=S3DV85_GLAL2|nr:UBC-like protein [Glarea lozoyensis ATCC 20868]EPE30278.1 UBC-like protein [Glarea lozoyensis ATCC 20868]